jgi:hypothetical protein
MDIKIQNPRAGFIQAPLSSNKMIRRASENVPPQVRVQSDIPAKRDDDGGLGSGSSSVRLFVSGERIGATQGRA